jgi:hypothetical protein
MIIGVTGHQKLDNPADWEWVQGELNRILDGTPSPIVGVSSLAIGADQLFAQAVLHHQGSLEVVIPFHNYERTFDDGPDKENYLRLLKAASKVDVLERKGSDEVCYFEAGKEVVSRADLLIAIWNGEPAAGLGGTGDAVNYALQNQRRVIHINPVTHQVIERGRGG